MLWPTVVPGGSGSCIPSTGATEGAPSLPASHAPASVVAAGACRVLVVLCAVDVYRAGGPNVPGRPLPAADRMAKLAAASSRTATGAADATTTLSASMRFSRATSRMTIARDLPSRDRNTPHCLHPYIRRLLTEPAVSRSQPAVNHLHALPTGYTAHHACAMRPSPYTSSPHNDVTHPHRLARTPVVVRHSEKCHTSRRTAVMPPGRRHGACAGSATSPRPSAIAPARRSPARWARRR